MWIQPTLESVLYLSVVILTTNFTFHLLFPQYAKSEPVNFEKSEITTMLQNHKKNFFYSKGHSWEKTNDWYGGFPIKFKV